MSFSNLNNYQLDKNVDGRFSNYMRIACLSFIFLIFVSGCSSSKSVSNSATSESNMISVEGYVSVRGNVPFIAVVLETDDRNTYILKLTPEMSQTLTTPARLNVTGRLYLDYWNGVALAHLEVVELERVME